MTRATLPAVLVAVTVLLVLWPLIERHPAPRPADDIPAAEAPAPSWGEGSGNSASGNLRPTGAPDSAPGAPIRPAIPGRGGISEAAPAAPPASAAVRAIAAGGRVTASAGARPSPTRRPAAIVTGGLEGTASWYCLPSRSACTRGYPSGRLYAAAGPAIRGALGSWRGRTVTVSTSRASVAVTLIDWCQCGERLLDLYAAVWFGLGVPLSAGLIDVTVSW